MAQSQAVYAAIDENRRLVSIQRVFEEWEKLDTEGMMLQLGFALMPPKAIGRK